MAKRDLPVWKSWNLTTLTQKWVNGTATNNGVVLWATNENTDGYDVRFRSSEYATPSERPYLEVIYSTEAATKTVYFLKDHLGSVRATVLDSAGAPVIGYDDYDPWGYPLTLRTKPIPNAYLQGASKNKFTGKERDDDYSVNLDYFGARYYDWLIGRWISVDPLWQKHPDVTPYNYVLNNPMILIDPDGKQHYYVNLITPIPSGKQVIENFRQSVELSKLYVSAGLYNMAVGNLIWGGIVAFGQMDAAGISGLASVMTIPEKVAATGAAKVSSEIGELAHATTDLRSLAKGFDPGKLDVSGRFGQAFYLSEKSGTAIAEVAGTGKQAQAVVSYTLDVKNANILDLTNPALAKEFGYTSNLGRAATQDIAEKAIARGYNVIKFGATKGEGANYAVLKDFEKVLQPNLPVTQ